MSYIHLLIIKDDCVYPVNVHYRTAMRLFDGGVERALPLLKHRFLDSGYLIVDVNKKLVINGQSAFPVGRVVRDWQVLDA